MGRGAVLLRPHVLAKTRGAFFSTQHLQSCHFVLSEVTRAVGYVLWRYRACTTRMDDDSNKGTTKILKQRNFGVVVDRAAALFWFFTPKCLASSPLIFFDHCTSIHRNAALDRGDSEKVLRVIAAKAKFSQMFNWAHHREDVCKSWANSEHHAFFCQH
jgi:hypothetical protein